MELPPEWPTIEWVRSFAQYKMYDMFEALDINIVYVFNLFKKCIHNDQELPVQTKRILHLLAMEVLMLNKHFVGNPHFDSFVKQLVDNMFTESLYKEHFRRTVDLEYKNQAKRRYIEFIFSHKLGDLPAKLISEFV